MSAWDGTELCTYASQAAAGPERLQPITSCLCALACLRRSGHLTRSAGHARAAGQHQLCQGGRLACIHNSHMCALSWSSECSGFLACCSIPAPAVTPKHANCVLQCIPSRSAPLQVSCGSVQTSTELFGLSGAYQGADKHSELNRFVVANEKK